MKRTLRAVALLLLALTLCFSMLSCTDTGNGTGNGNGDSTGDSTGSSTGNSTGSGSENTEVGEKIEEKIEETTCFTHNGITVVAKSITEDFLAKSLNLYISNSSSSEYGVSVEEAYINGCRVMPVFAETVEAGGYGFGSVDFINLDELGINVVGEIEIYFQVFDAKTYETVYSAEPVVIKTSAYDKAEKLAYSGKVIYNNDGVKVTVIGINNDTSYGKSLDLFVENNSGGHIGLSVEDVTVNGNEMLVITAKTARDGKCMVSNLDFMSYELEYYGITTIEEIKFIINIFDGDTCETIATSSEITYEP